MIDVNRYGNPLFTYCADKILARNYVARATSPKYLNKIFWCGDDPECIPFDELPERCIIKTNHGSGQNVFFESGVDFSEVVSFFKRSLSNNYYWISKEFHYFSINRKVFVEKILDDGCEGGPIVYSFWIFHGSYFIIQVDNSDRSINTFYDKDWSKLDVKSRVNRPDLEVDRPENLDEMIEFATKLGKDFDFVRVDMYNTFGKIYFSELTFHPGGAAFKFTPPEWEYRLGEKWHYTREANIRRKAPDAPPLEGG